MNQILLIGNVGNEPTTTGTVTKITLATSKKFKDKEGNTKEETQWHRVVFFGKLAELVSKYVAKGSKILVAGEVKYNDYVNKEGVKVYTTDIIADKLEFLSVNNSKSEF